MRFTEILDSGSIPWEGTGPDTRKGWIQFDCPFCQGRLYMGYNTKGNYCNCWRCGGFNLGIVFSSLLKVTVNKGKELANSLDLEMDYLPPEFKKGELKLPPGLCDGLLQGHKRYLKGRGFANPSFLERVWGLKSIGLTYRLRFRLFIPITYRGEIVSWTTRRTNKELRYAPSNSPRYIAAKPEDEALPAKSLLFGEDLARHKIVICEGPMDAMRIGPGAVAIMGTSYTTAQILRMSKFPCRTILFDSEPEAQRRAFKLMDILKTFEGSTANLCLGEGVKDPAEAPVETVSKIRYAFLEEVDCYG